MQAFGIELRKLNGIISIYEDVDKILDKKNTSYKLVTDNDKKMSIAHSLNKMMKPEKYFDICCIRECAKLAEICIPIERMNFYQPLHCISWNEMLPEFRTRVIAMVLDDFRAIFININM